MPFKAVIIVGSAQSHNGHHRGTARRTALEHVANRPIVHHVLDALAGAGVDGVIVAGESDALIDVRVAVHAYEPRLDQVDYALCRNGDDVVSVLATVAPLVGNARCLIHPADGLLDEPPDLLRDEGSDLVLFVAPELEHALGDGEWSREEAFAAHRRNGHRTADVGVFAPGALSRTVEAMQRAGRTDLTAAGQRLAADGGSVRLHPVTSWRRYRGEGRDLLELNRVALDRLTGEGPAFVDRTNRLEGRVRVHPTASIRGSSIIGPTVIGPGATVTDAYIGPYTSIGAGARIEGVEVERSIIFPGAHVMHVGARLVSSLVGRDARVFRDFSLPRALRLWVGDGDEVALC